MTGRLYDWLPCAVYYSVLYVISKSVLMLLLYMLNGRCTYSMVQL